MKYLLFYFFLLPSLAFAQQQKIQTLKLDTLKRNDTITISEVKLATNRLKIDKEINVGFVNLKIFHNRNGSIANELKKYNPKKDELYFFYGQNYKIRKLEMHFKIGQTLKPIYAKKDFNQLLEVIKVLEYQIFDIDSFSGTTAFSALQEADYK